MSESNDRYKMVAGMTGVNLTKVMVFCFGEKQIKRVWCPDLGPLDDQGKPKGTFEMYMRSSLFRTEQARQTKASVEAYWKIIIKEVG